jgi:hypothetical protein
MTAVFDATGRNNTRKKNDHDLLSLKESRRLNPEKYATDVLRLTHLRAGSWPRAYLLLKAGK